LYAEEYRKTHPGVTVDEFWVVWGPGAMLIKKHERYAHFNVFIPVFLFNNPPDL